MNSEAVRSQGLLGVGLYTAPDAARLLSFEIGAVLSGKKLRRWALGYRYRTVDRAILREAEPIVGARLRGEGYDLFTFAELIELLVIGAFREEGVSSAVIRAARNRACEMFGENPFARRRFETDGKHIFVTLAAAELGSKLSEANFTLEVTRGQGALEAVVRPLFRRIDYIGDLAGRFWPLGRNRSVVIDPARSFGEAVENESGVPTATLYATHKAGESNSAIADWYGVSLQGVADALEYESAIATAA